jgi:hypothetical protein
MWGGSETLKAISVDRQSISVRQNLWFALDALRDQVNPRTLWTNALCINQDDVQGRNRQVAMMGRIYQEATKVLVWLGEAADDSEIVFDRMNPEGADPIWSWDDGPCESAIGRLLPTVLENGMHHPRHLRSYITGYFLRDKTNTDATIPPGLGLFRGETGEFSRKA